MLKVKLLTIVILTGALSFIILESTQRYYSINYYCNIFVI